MSEKINRAFYDIGHLDSLAEADTPLHRLDPRAKVLVTAVFIICVVSFDKYEIARLLPFFLYPALLIGLGNLPLGFLLRKLLMVSPFVIFIGIFNPWLDRTVLLHLGSLHVTGGWLSFISLLLRFSLTVGCALILIASTGFPAFCMALEKLGAPRILAVQLLLLYRYLFILIGEAIRMIRAHSLRSFNRKSGISFKVFLQMLGNLLLRTIDRAQRIHRAMLSRAFTREIRIVRQFSFGYGEAMFLIGFSGLFIVLRLTDVADLLGRLLLEISR
ncbi:MAG: cobalt ECF transporter T component CbiQ [Proteobacteria bacterium]|nr:cobalt ECF transporter T component CbiQ [Pseudomonadota bacterium]MBU1738986.1 cobalt ECF transporter T component CbiQ [Pseudomonadota bacterium]